MPSQKLSPTNRVQQVENQLLERLPDWENLDKGKRQALLHQLLLAIAEWRPLPPVLLRPLPPSVLRQLLEVIETLKSEGLAGAGRQTPARVKRLRELIRARGLSDQTVKAKDDRTVEKLPTEARQQVRAQEALAMRQTHAHEAQMNAEQLARLNNPLA